MYRVEIDNQRQLIKSKWLQIKPSEWYGYASHTPVLSKDFQERNIEVTQQTQSMMIKWK